MDNLVTDVHVTVQKSVVEQDEEVRLHLAGAVYLRQLSLPDKFSGGMNQPLHQAVVRSIQCLRLHLMPHRPYKVRRPGAAHLAKFVAVQLEPHRHLRLVDNGDEKIR